MSGSKQKWFPLESNPDLVNSYISNLGFNTSLYKFHEVFSTEDWAIGMVPQPTLAVMMLYPITKAQEEHREQERKELFDAATTDGDGETNKSDVWHIKQRIGNACGTIGILHALGNLPPSLQEAAIAKDSWLQKFYADSPAGLDSTAKAEKLEVNEDIAKMHDAATSDMANQTSRGNVDDKVETHFVAITNVGGEIYELDGRKEGPVKHGKTTDASFLTDACKVVEKFMKRDPGELRFTIMALGPNQD